jgi:transposase
MLDMAALGFKYAKTKDTGRPPHNPGNMLMLYLYGYLNRIRSSRRLEAETKRNVEVMWLMERVTPDDKTICNFRKDNTKAIRKVFREFSLWCSRQGLYGKELVAVDSTKIRANTSRRNIHTQRGTEKELAIVEKKITEYMRALEENDVREEKEDKLSSEAIEQALKRLSQKKEALEEWLAKIEENGGKEISTVDPDARIMSQGGDGRPIDACYNVQAVADGKHKLIVDFKLSTSPDDKGSLFEMTERAKEFMGTQTISAVADKGYYDGANIDACEKAGTSCFVPISESGRHVPDSRYDHEKFRYDVSSDFYLCPQGSILSFKGLSKRVRAEKSKTGKDVIDRLYENSEACQNCAYRSLCTASKRGVRIIRRAPNQDALDTHNAKMSTEDGRRIMRERKKIIEHPFGTTKRVWGYGQFLCRQLESTTAEQSLAFLAYNFRRVVNIFMQDEKDLLSAFV